MREPIVLEKVTKARLRRALASLCAGGVGWFCFPPANGYGRAGIPDVIGVYRGFMFAIECKSSVGKLSVAQRTELGKVTAAGGLGMVCRPGDVDAVIRALQTLDDARVH